MPSEVLAFRKKFLIEPIIPFILDNIHTGIIAIDRDGRVFICNSAAREMMGFESDVLGKPIASIVPGTKLLGIINTGQAEFGKKFDFNNKTFVSNRTPIKVDDEVVGAVAVFQDITELEGISTELESFKRINGELEGIISSSHDGIIITDGDGIVLKTNNSIQRVTKLSSEYYIGKKIDSLYEEGYFAFEPVAKQARVKKEIVTGLQKIKTGKEVMVTSNPVLDDEGNVIRVVTNVKDMSDIVHLQEQLTRSRQISKQLLSEFNKALEEELCAQEVITRNPEMMKILELTRRVAQCGVTVLLQGESGVGKEVFAKLVHVWSKRKGAFIKINCSALPAHLLESELFGYAGGAFTGANKDGKPGLFELADEGTLLLDEIEDLPMELQGKFLRVLQDLEFMRIGGTKVIKVNVRLIAASNKNLHEMVEEKQFRKDLFYRLNVVPITIPPLRDRPEDIPLLIEHFLDKFNRKYGFARRLTPELYHKFMSYSWPGNIREIINTLERMVITSPDEVIRENPLFIKENAEFLPEEEKRHEGEDFTSLKEALEKVEREILVNTLNRYKSSRTVGKVLGISHTAVRKKMNKYNL